MDTLRATARGLIKEWTGYSPAYAALVQGAVAGRREIITWEEVSAIIHDPVTPTTWDRVRLQPWNECFRTTGLFLEAVWCVGTGRCLRRGHRVQ